MVKKIEFVSPNQKVKHTPDVRERFLQEGQEEEGLTVLYPGNQRTLKMEWQSPNVWTGHQRTA